MDAVTHQTACPGMRPLLTNNKQDSKMKKQTNNKNAPAVKVKPASGIAEKLDYEIASDRRINLTREKAYAFLELATFQGERQVNERHVQALYNAFNAGRFMWEHVLIALCECEGKVYRINGQHTCWMRVNIDKDEEAPVREMVYKVKDEAALRAVYSTFDQNKQRTPGHVMKALLVGTPEVAEIWPSQIGQLAAGLKMHLYEGRGENISVPDMAEIVSHESNDLFKQVGVFYQAQYDNYINIRRKACIAALFATFAAAPQKAYEFWTPICEQLGFTGKDDLRYKLRRFIDEHKMSRSFSTGMMVCDEDLYRICINAWNKWRKGEAVTNLRTTDKRVKAV